MHAWYGKVPLIIIFDMCGNIGNERGERNSLVQSPSSFLSLTSVYCVLSWYKCKYSVVYLRTVSSKVHGMEQN